MRTRFLCGVIAIASSIGAAGTSGLNAAVVVIQSSSFVLRQDAQESIYLYPTLGFQSTSYNGTTSAIKLTAGANGLQASDEHTGRVASLTPYGSFATKFASDSLIESSDFTGSDVIKYLYQPGGGVKNQFTLGGSSGYIGFSFVDSSSLTHYGWARVSVRDALAGIVPTPSYEMTLYEWAYETVANTAIAAGAVSSIPEPAADSALAGLGVLGLCWLRRKKR
ncbi:MAG: hypothetical protein ABW223_04545 [Rariglobus sp.]